MGNAISACMKKYATFAGRASRSEFWYFYLFYIIMYAIGAGIGIAIESQIIMYLFIAPFWLPCFAAGVRRMHDVGRSGWFILVPIYNIVLWCTQGNSETNKYGDL
jgi:uncharacterized membrane protein YhaH (DUF805 family)